MFVFESTYNKLKEEKRELERDLYVTRLRERVVDELYIETKREVSRLKTRLAEKSTNSATFSQEDLKRLLSLVHPDKHGGKQSAVEFTQKILKALGK